MYTASATSRITLYALHHWIHRFNLHTNANTCTEVSLQWAIRSFDAMCCFLSHFKCAQRSHVHTKHCRRPHVGTHCMFCIARLALRMCVIQQFNDNINNSFIIVGFICRRCWMSVRFLILLFFVMFRFVLFSSRFQCVAFVAAYHLTLRGEMCTTVGAFSLCRSIKQSRCFYLGCVESERIRLLCHFYI